MNDPTTYGYCLKSCTLPFLEEAARWYEGRYGVGLDPRREALALIGSQEGLAHLLLALTEPEDLLLLPEVAYPSYFGAARVASLRTFLIPLREDGLADLKAVPEGVWREAKVLLLNYPNNPTGAVADWGYFEEALGLARKHGLWLIHDNPYVDQVYEGEAPPPGPPRGQGAGGGALLPLQELQPRGLSPGLRPGERGGPRPPGAGEGGHRLQPVRRGPAHGGGGPEDP